MMMKHQHWQPSPVAFVHEPETGGVECVKMESLQCYNCRACDTDTENTNPERLGPANGWIKVQGISISILCSSVLFHCKQSIASWQVSLHRAAQPWQIGPWKKKQIVNLKTDSLRNSILSVHRIERYGVSDFLLGRGRLHLHYTSEFHWTLCANVSYMSETYKSIELYLLSPVIFFLRLHKRAVHLFY